MRKTKNEEKAGGLKTGPVESIAGAVRNTGQVRLEEPVVAYSRPGKRRWGVPGGKSGVVTHIHDIKKGYSVKRFDSLKESLGLKNEELAKITNMSLATIHRRKASGQPLTPDESEKIYRLEKLHAIANEVMAGDENSVRSWFNTPQTVFGGKKPLEFADTLPGCEEIERVLRRMEQGILL